MTININHKFFIISLILIYILAAYYLYNYHYTKLNAIKHSRYNTITDIEKVEDKLKTEYSKSPSIKKSYTIKDPSVRLSNEVGIIEKELREIVKQIDDFKKKIEIRLQDELKNHISNNEKKDYKKPEILVVESDSSDEVVGDGPTNNEEVNKEISLTMNIKEQADKIIAQLSTEVPYYNEKLENSLKAFNEIDSPELTKRSSIQWKLLNRISLIEEKINEFRKSLLYFTENNLKYENKVKSLVEKDFNERYLKTAQTLPLFDFHNLLSHEIANTNSLVEKLSVAQVSADNDMAVNFINYKDYYTLSNHFGKEFKYKKLISTHDLLTKEKFTSALSLRSKVLIYMELFTGRRIGVYIDSAFPKNNKFPKSFKDPNAFIVYFNNKEFYKANPDTNTQFRTDYDYLILIGNTKNNDGIWIKIPETNNEYPVHFGKPTNEYDCSKGTLLTSPIIDRIYSFEVYELDLSN